MVSERITIGALARRSGVPVKTLRFYSDEGLLPPAGRTRSGYRVYAEDALARLELVRTLREAGLGLAAIKAILARDLSLAEALRLRLGAVEAHIASLQHVAAALRAALRREPIEANIGRLCTVTRLTADQRQAVITRFAARIAEGVPEDAWQRRIIDANIPALPAEPTPQQLDAWIELAELVQDEDFIGDMQASAAAAWPGALDLAAQQRVASEANAAARAMLDRGVPPTAQAAREVVEHMAAGLAAAAGKPDDAAFRADLRSNSSTKDPRVTRYWQLTAALTGATASHEEWHWLAQATVHHLAPA